MRHLRQAAVIFDPAADHPLGADRQQPLQLVAAHVEVDQRQHAGAVAQQDAVRSAAKAWLMLFDDAPDRHNSVRPIVRIKGTDRRRGAAIDQARRQVPQQINHRRPGGALDQAAELRPDAGQHGHRRKQPIEKGGTHA